MGISSCAGGKEYLLEQNPPFEVKASYFQKWVAGVEEGGSGTNVYITLENIKEEILVKEIYFGDRFLNAERNPQNMDSYSANFKNEGRQDVVMDGDIINESQNTPAVKSPFSLGNNEAIISYTVKDEMHYYKISNLKEKPMLAYPSSRPNGGIE
jgi:hypothetical protein